jgi:catalase
VWDEAQKISGLDPDFHRRDLWEAIANGDFPEWELGVQLVEEKYEHAFDFDLLDPTKIIPEELVPVKRIGKLTLNRNPDNFFAETEQVAFHPGHLVSGIDFSDDPLLQGRLFSYTDTQLIRLGGPNFHEIPINRSVAPVHNNQRDGYMRQTINQDRVSYQPNSLGGGCPMQAKADMGGFVSYAERMEGSKVRARSEKFFDHFSQAALFWNSQSHPEKAHIVQALRFELGKVEVPAIRERMVFLLAQVDKTLAGLVAQGLGISVPTKVAGPINLSVPADGSSDRFQPKRRTPTLERSTALSMANTVKKGIATRKVAILAADGVDDTAIIGMKKALTAAGAQAKVVAPRLGSVNGIKGGQVAIDFSFLTAASVLFDALYLPGGGQSMEILEGDAKALLFIKEAYLHCKPIAATDEGMDLLAAAQLGADKMAKSHAEGVLQDPESLIAGDEGIVTGRGAQIGKVAGKFIKAMAQHRHWDRESKGQMPA